MSNLFSDTGKRIKSNSAIKGLLFPTLVLLVSACSGCHSDEADSEPSKSTVRPSQKEEKTLGAPNVSLDLLSVVDRTQVSTEAGVAPLVAHLDRILIHWWEVDPIPVYGVIQDDQTGETLRVLFEGRAKPGTVELSFLASVLDPSAPHRWLLTNQTTSDTIQFIRFRIPS